MIPPAPARMLEYQTGQLMGLTLFPLYVEWVGWICYINEARVTEKGFSLKSLFAAAAVLTCLVDCRRHVALVDGDNFTTEVC